MLVNGLRLSFVFLLYLKVIIVPISVLKIGSSFLPYSDFVVSESSSKVGLLLICREVCAVAFLAKAVLIQDTLKKMCDQH